MSEMYTIAKTMLRFKFMAYFVFQMLVVNYSIIMHIFPILITRCTRKEGKYDENKYF